MKKSIFLLGMAVLSFSNVTFASTTKSETAAYEVAAATPLCTAISKGEFEIVKKFVEYGADVNEKSNGLTPLMIAARYNNIQILEYLIAKGANVNAKTENGYTALKYAEASNASDAVAFLKGVSKK